MNLVILPFSFVILNKEYKRHFLKAELSQLTALAAKSDGMLF
jgi:hypothetical protein